MRSAIIVSGLPASGKTTLARKIAAIIEWPSLDKDDFLEALFDERGVGDLTWRRQLSIEADDQFQEAALALDRVVLTSHWQPAGITGTGTPTDWLADCATLIEVHLDCAPHVAADRFMARRRHPGHCDAHRPKAEVLPWMERLQTGFPLGIGTLVPASRDGKDTILAIRKALAQAGPLADD